MSGSVARRERIFMPDRPEQSDPLRCGLSIQQLDLILRKLESLPTIPAVAMCILELTTSTSGGEAADTRSTEALVELIRTDPSLTARLLSLAGRDKADAARTVDQAAQRLGLEAVRSAVLSISIFESLRRPAPNDSGLDAPGFRQHCLAVAAAAEMLVEAMDLPIEPEEAFVCGLLHDLGKLALAQCLPKSYRRVLEAVGARNGDVADLEREIIGADHTVAGRHLAKQWRLPKIVQDVIWLHHQPVEAVPPSLPHRELIGVVNLADAIARQQRIGFSGNTVFARTPAETARQMHLPKEELDRLIERLPERICRQAEPIELRQAAGEGLYREALLGANAELGRLNEELRTRADALRAQAKAMEHLRSFVSDLPPEAPVADILARMAEVMAAAHGLESDAGTPVVAYCFGPAEDTVLAVCCDGTGAEKWRTLPVGADAATQQTSNGQTTASAAKLLSVILADANGLNDWVDLSTYAHQSLCCGRRWIGGLLYRPACRRPVGEEDFDRALAGVPALALATALERSKAVVLSEQLAGALQALAETQEALAEARTLAAVGEMAAGAAHELNNPLAVISGRAQLMREKAHTAEDRKTWQLVADQAQRISDIVSALMGFASPPEPKPAQLDAGKLLQEAADAFSSSEHPQAASACVDISVGRNVPSVWADREQTHAVLTELIRNAATAAKPEPFVRLTAEADEAGRAVLLTVEDNGGGMDAETLAQAFTPFFSSQKAGRRRGLGLSTAKRYVENNGGRIWIRTQPGEGTTVFVQLPAADSEEQTG